MERKNAVAVITARGGSKRIPHKNIKEFCGRPIIEYSIEAALKSGVFDEVMVSTDDSETVSYTHLRQWQKIILSVRSFIRRRARKPVFA